MPSTFSTASKTTASTAWPPWPGPWPAARKRSCSATPTAAPCRTRSRRSWRGSSQFLDETGSSARIGIHSHNDSETAVANSLMSVHLGATHVQGTINGYGERCGNANLTSIIPALIFKMGLECEVGKRIDQLYSTARLRGRTGQPAARPLPALRGRLGLCPQGRRARERGAAQPGHLRAHRPGKGRQHAPGAASPTSRDGPTCS